MNENIFDKRRLKTFSNCKELVKSMIGTRDGLIAYNEKFRLDLENTCYKASICEDLQQENKQLKEELNILTINYKTLSADIGTVAEYMKLNEYAIIEEMIDRAVELVEKEKRIDKAIEWIYISQQNKDNKHLEPIISTDELDELLEILKGSN